MRVSEGAPTYVRRDPMFARVIFPAVPHDLADPVPRARELIAAQGPIIHKHREREIRVRGDVRCETCEMRNTGVCAARGGKRGVHAQVGKLREQSNFIRDRSLEVVVV